MKNNLIKIGMIFMLVIVLTGIPSIFTQQVHGLLGTKFFHGGSFSGKFDYLDSGGYLANLNGFPRSCIVCCPLGSSKLSAKIKFTIEVEDLDGHNVNYNMYAEFGRYNEDTSVTLRENRIVNGRFYVTRPLMYNIEVVPLSLQGDIYIDGGLAESYEGNTGQITIVRTLFGFLEWLFDFLDFPVCFLGGTRVMMANGTYKNIESVEVGDLVLSYDINNGSVDTATVTEVFVHDAEEMPDYYVIINDVIRVTPNHMLYINDVLTPAGCAEIGDRLITYNGSEVLIESIEQVFEQVQTYNFYINRSTSLYLVEQIPSLPYKVNAVALEESICSDFIEYVEYIESDAIEIEGD